MTGLEVVLLLQASTSAVQPASGVPTVAPPRQDYPSAGAGAPPQSPTGPSVSSVNAPDAGLAAPAALQPPPPTFLRRTGPLCSDFTAAPGAGWTVGAPVEFPGPRGPVQLTQGQVIQPGDYVQGMDLGSVLQRDCPRVIAPPRPPTG
jgi:hypothetical protein